jgi:DNA-binding LacI/PurR family transcriptional regulator
MKSKIPIAEQLQAEIECQLAQPPAQAGMRLKTVRELARMIGASHDTVQRSLGGLVERGILTRKHGSGVYVRKVPPAPTQALGDGPRLLKWQSIFADDPAPTRLRAEAEGARLQLDLWWENRALSVSGRLSQRGILDQARELGHRLRVRTLDEGSNGAPSRVKPSPGCDGHIVLVSVAETFQRVVPLNHVPTVYVWVGNASPEFQPLVQIDMDDALERAIRLLAKQGHERIGLLSWTDLEARQRSLYEGVMEGLGRSYRAAEFSDATEEHDAAAVRRLFERSDAPEALYVADDIMMRLVLPALRGLGREPGRNLALITHANRGNPLPKGMEWSRMEFDPYSVGRLAMQSLVREIESSGDELLSFSHQAAWKPGTTHLRAGESL